MKDGYYLSAYAMINPLSYLYNLKIRHDYNMALWEKKNRSVKLLHFWELERLTGMKQHHQAFYSYEHAIKFINELLSTYGITLDQINEVWGIPGIGELENYFTQDLYKQYSYHNLCHLFGSMMMNMETFKRENIIAFAIDSAPDHVLNENYNSIFFYTGAYSEKGNIELFPINSPGELWAVASKFFNLREGTLMALASASTSELFEPPELNTIIFNWHSRENIYYELDKFFTQTMSLTKADESKQFNAFDQRFSEEENKISMAMKVIQNASFKCMEININHVLEKYQINVENTYLAIGGGFGLNCPTNSYLMSKYKFKKIIAPPYMNDCGISIGIGLHTFYHRIKEFDFEISTAYYGNEDLSLSSALKKYEGYIVSSSEMDYSQMVNDISNDVIAWFDGRSEIGPRALGHRSLLADPRSETSKVKLNTIKQRQWWRPVAPIILEEELENWFEDTYASPYMLSNFKVKDIKRDYVKSVLHLDGTARVQSITECDNEKLYRFISIFNKKTGVPIICNTSLNDKGEPIIDTIEELFNFILRKNIKIAYINGYRVEFTNHQNYYEQMPAKRKFDMDSYLSKKKKQEEKDRLNPYCIHKKQLNLYINMKFDFDITTKQGANVLNRLYQLSLRNQKEQKVHHE